ncbi:MAG: PSD1 domain-containing protein [Pirellulales bacterium]|nr:PSD1 domain-containing protein [Pirellulales bacterium]
MLPLCAAELDDNRDVRPILANHCFKCHGPDDATRESGLRLDERQSATGQDTASGQPAIVPGSPDESELIRRIVSDDASELMPPPAANKALSDEKKEVLRRWIAEGAIYRTHWAFVPPVEPSLPQVKLANWPRNPIDLFVLARLEAEGLRPSPEADRYTLVRRAYLDLIGLPPTVEEADAFVFDSSPDAYEKLVDRLLASPHYGERWARLWLDLARYADTNGYEKDRPRSIWPYRDWVIKALNADMPFDQFTIEQLAGDMLPDATLEQRIATGFHRNTMLNEEGGIDPLEFRFHAMVDRVATTGTVWLGLTTGCAQCHTHKFDPITHKDYYRLMAFLDNAYEPELDVPTEAQAARRREIEREIATLTASLPERFPPAGEVEWSYVRPTEMKTKSGATAELLDDSSMRFSGKLPAEDVYTLSFETPLDRVAALRIEVLPDDSLPHRGPGRAENGNFVLSEVALNVPSEGENGATRSIPLVWAEVDFAQGGFPAEKMLDGDGKTGWAIDGPGDWHVARTARLMLDEPLPAEDAPTRWTLRLDQLYGGQHLIGRLRVSVGKYQPDGPTLAERRIQHREAKYQAWLAAQSARAVRWTTLRPIEATSNLPRLTVQEDDSVFSSGDQTKSDMYRLAFVDLPPRVTAVRLETLTDERLPKNGPGRVYYEGPFGDFFLSEFSITADGSPVKIASATQTFASGSFNAAAAIDGDQQSGWSINGGQGRAQAAVFTLAQPLEGAKALDVSLLCEKYYSAGIGRFRISVTDDSRPVEANPLPAALEAALLEPESERTPEARAGLLAEFAATAPELALARREIDRLRQQLPVYATTLVMSERPADEPRPTHLHHRGEYQQPTELVSAELPAIFEPLPADVPHDRLSLARWLVGPDNPLTARVTVNRQWAALFGRGLVRTTEDFGHQGDPPSHPELLDWLAIELVRGGWSMKSLHRLMVTSATYRQDASALPALLARDPENRLLARGPRRRLEAEQLRDTALRVAGLLSPKMFGPSVFPPQPAGVTTEGAYGQLAWKTSEGEDRYRRGLYTYMKRTAPFAMSLTFDGPSGEACVARRESSNTPLQALTLLNDVVFVESAQVMGRELAARNQATPGERVQELFRRYLTRPPQNEERDLLVAYYTDQRARLAAGEVSAARIVGADEKEATSDETIERAAWTLVARAVMNLDEAISTP